MLVCLFPCLLAVRKKNDTLHDGSQKWGLTLGCFFQIQIELVVIF